MIRLGVNIDHVATVRQARGEPYPDPVQAAVLAELGGADNITAHLREDRRHIQDRDVYLLKDTIKIPLNFEMAASAEMLKIALKVNPHAVTLVPEKREERTTEGGLDLRKNFKLISAAVDKLQSQGILVALFIEPNANAIELAVKTKAKAIEFHTGHWAKHMTAAVTTKRKWELTNVLSEASVLAAQSGLQSHFGHGITYSNAGWLQHVESAEEANIGHVIVGRAIFVGLTSAVKEMKDILNSVTNKPFLPTSIVVSEGIKSYRKKV